MTAFNYIALAPPHQKRKKGVIEADSARQARQKLRDSGLFPLEVKAAAEKREKKALFARFALKRKWSTADLALVTRQMATLLSSSIPIDEMLMAVYEQAETMPVKRVLLGLRTAILEGRTLSDGMNDFPSVFPKIYRTTVAAGEQSGQLGRILLRLAEFVERQHDLRNKLRQALIYPCLMMVVSVAIVTFLLLNVVPKILGALMSVHQTLPMSTAILLKLTGFLRDEGVWVLLSVSLAVSLFIFLLKRRSGFRKRMHMFLLKWPVVGKTVRLVNCARFGRTLGILTASGVPVLDAMQAASQLIVPIPMSLAIEQAIDQVREGQRLHQALQQTGYFPPLFVHLVASGEASGQLATMLEKAASYLSSDVENVLQNVLTLFEPLMILLMGAVVLFIVLAVMLPIFSLDQLGDQL